MNYYLFESKKRVICVFNVMNEELKKLGLKEMSPIERKQFRESPEGKLLISLFGKKKRNLSHEYCVDKKSIEFE